MTSPLFQATVRAGLGLLTAVFLAGCVGAPRWGSWSKHPSPEQLAAASSQTAARVQYADGVYGAQR